MASDRDTLAFDNPDRLALEALAEQVLQSDHFRAPVTFALRFITAILEAGWRPPVREIFLAEDFADGDAAESEHR
ncbi:hypothetical protein AB0H76_15175 [Nocardia sp. NPDC050712]|uniref:hypothetical protein n=1 Tax=Nocardia sp. NPDC050712 TaxID=3155518 RepID=UPI0033CF9B07